MSGNKKKEIAVRTIETIDGWIYEGSYIRVTKEYKKSYRGLFCSSAGSYVVTVPKTKCEIIK